MHDCCIVGGGVIGLSIAWELAGRGKSVSVVSRDSLRNGTSWAAAGIFPAQPRATRTQLRGTPIERLTQYSDRLHQQWAESLLGETGIDNGFRRCGSLAIATTEETEADILDCVKKWERLQVEHEPISSKDLRKLEPALDSRLITDHLRSAYYLPNEAQVRPPRHLRALREACLNRGVEILNGVQVESFHFKSGQIVEMNIAGRNSTPCSIHAGQFCIAAGAWSERLLQMLNLNLPTKPWRGQILLHKTAPGALRHIVNIGSGLDYIIPRSDGHLLIGSTIEDVGFDASTTPFSLERLSTLAGELLPDLMSHQPEAFWAGLRPGSPDGLPTIGRVPALDNAWLATGHYRSGFHLSTGTAHLIADSMCGISTQLNMNSFSVERASLLESTSLAS
ncbi:MAG: glycine oxidase ThiO [Pirellulales bacterium]